ncbi:uncharacterized protein LOC100369841 [Saccoglossus kowalevskii]|uniref:Uncharacterized protein LOC100369841 n=1 Tax=Saccoglossus kowalevskii TaxID=10224 RepID=A0ABM0GY88_SACKO|nr:PREDICTED: uncharacterized protein LOC100369841 [Saccoglossus kowalevskii]
MALMFFLFIVLGFASYEGYAQAEPVTSVVIDNTENPITIRDGETLTISCSVYDIRPSANVSWVINGEVITEGISHNVTEDGDGFDTTSVLYMVVTSDYDQKDLICRARNDENEINTYVNKSVTLDVTNESSGPNKGMIGGLVGAASGVTVVMIIIISQTKKYKSGKCKHSSSSEKAQTA